MGANNLYRNVSLEEAFDELIGPIQKDLEQMKAKQELALELLRDSSSFINILSLKGESLR